MQKTMYWTVCATSFAICFFFSLYLVYMANERIAFVNVHLDTKNLCLNLFLVILFIAINSENRTINSVSQNAKIFVVGISSLRFLLFYEFQLMRCKKCNVLFSSMFVVFCFHFWYRQNFFKQRLIFITSSTMGRKYNNRMKIE